MHHTVLVLSLWKDFGNRRNKTIPFVTRDHPHATEAAFYPVPEKMEPVFRFFPTALTDS